MTERLWGPSIQLLASSRAVQAPRDPASVPQRVSSLRFSERPPPRKLHPAAPGRFQSSVLRRARGTRRNLPPDGLLTAQGTVAHQVANEARQGLSYQVRLLPAGAQRCEAQVA